MAAIDEPHLDHVSSLSIGTVWALVTLMSAGCFVVGCWMRNVFVAATRRDHLVESTRAGSFASGAETDMELALFDGSEAAVDDIPFSVARPTASVDAEFLLVDTDDEECSEGYTATMVRALSQRLSDEAAAATNEVDTHRVSQTMNTLNTEPNVLNAIREALQRQRPQAPSASGNSHQASILAAIQHLNGSTSRQAPSNAAAKKYA